MKHVRSPLPIATSLLILAVPALAQAQTVEEGHSAESANQLSDIVVTATKEQSKIQEVPGSVIAVSGADLMARGVNKLSDLAGAVPGLNIGSGGAPGQDLVTIRGISPNTSTATVGTYIDDIPVGSSNAWLAGAKHFVEINPFDLDRVEVLEGPQGTLYGAGAMSGLIKFALREPDLKRTSVDLGGEISSISSSSAPGYTVRGAASLPIVSDKLAIRASGFYTRQAGYIDNAQTATKNENSYDQYGARGTILWKPTDRLTLKGTAIYQKTDANGESLVALDSVTLKPLHGPLDSNHALPEYFRQTLQIYNGEIGYDLGFSKLISVTSYQKSRMAESTDNPGQVVSFSKYVPGTPNVGASMANLGMNLDKVTEEVRLSGNHGRYQWLAGLFYTNEDGFYHPYYTAQTLTGAYIGGGLNPLLNTFAPTTYREYAAFANARAPITDKLDIGGGIRWAHNHQDFEYNTVAGYIVQISDVFSHTSESNVTYSVDARYFVKRDVMFYGRIATGYRPGGPNLPLGGAPTKVESDRTTNYEVGVKSDFFDHKLRVNLSAFSVDWSNIQLRLYLPNGFSYYGNGSGANSKGFEAEVSAKPTRELTLSGNLSYTDATLTADAPSVSGKKGDKIPYAPSWTGAFNADYKKPVGAFTANLGASVRYVDSQYNAMQSASTTQLLPSYSLVDLRAGISKPRWDLMFRVNNVTNNHNFISITRLSGVQSVGAVLQPRTFSLSFDLHY